MFNIHDAENLQRVLPEYLENLLNEQDRILNRLPTDKLLSVFEAGECRAIIDRTMALTAARSGLPVSSLAIFFSLLFPVLIVAAIAVFFFWGWEVSALSILGAIISFRVSRHFAVEDVRNAALKDKRLLALLMSKGVIYFRMENR